MVHKIRTKPAYIVRPGRLEQEVKGNGSDSVNDEPPSDVVVGDLSGVDDHLPIVKVRRPEVDEYVGKKHDIDDHVDDVHGRESDIEDRRATGAPPTVNRARVEGSLASVSRSIPEHRGGLFLVEGRHVGGEDSGVEDEQEGDPVPDGLEG